MHNQLVPLEPTVDYFQAVRGMAQGPLQAYRDGSLGAAAQQFGQTLITTTPIVSAARALRYRKHTTGAMGQTDMELTGLMAGAIILGLIVRGALGYQAGKAMAPNRRDAKTWAWIGVPVGTLTGTLGLGVMGIVSNSKR